ncbi:MAG: hypothetical protein JXR61_14210 [Prolixibacteraceae bacterium]|nr:hypothetical protein [Prolixibacteraceae bacterium]
MINEEMDFTDIRKLRKEAERLLNEKHRNKDEALRKADVNKLVHELQVHQIELEMQNEELRQAYDTMEKALKKYVMIFELSPVGYLTLDADGTICELNFTAAEMLNEKRFSLLNSNFKLFISEKSRPVFNNFFKKVYTSQAKESCQVILGYDTTELGRVYMEGVVTEEEQKCLLSVVDISRFSNV